MRAETFRVLMGEREKRGEKKGSFPRSSRVFLEDQALSGTGRRHEEKMGGFRSRKGLKGAGLKRSKGWMHPCAR